MAAISLSACGGFTGGQAEEPDLAQTANAPIDCALVEGFVIDYVEGDEGDDDSVGYATPQGALENLEQDHGYQLPSGPPSFMLEEEETVTWVYLDNEGKKIWSVTAELYPWGLWYIGGGQYCYEE
jgi:hypothetical protein